MAKAREREAEQGDRHWHLSRTAEERAITALEYALFHCFEGFTRWQAECSAAAGVHDLSGADTGILHIVRMHDRPKGISEIARQLNRDDIANLQYSIRKLTKAGLVEKAAASSAKKDVTYQVSTRGRAMTEVYARIRLELLVPLTRALASGTADFEQSARVLNLMTGMYDQAARLAATRKPEPRGIGGD